MKFLRQVRIVQEYEIVYNYTKRKIKYLESIDGTPAGKAMMAEIRHGAGRHPGEMPDLWGLVFDGLPEELMGAQSVSDAEWAIYSALTLYALHQQGKDRPMQADKVSLGQAAARLVKDEDDRERVLRRLSPVVTATSKEDLAQNLRGLVQLLKSDDIALDHARLAKEIYLFGNPDFAGNIKLAWGRDFYREKFQNSEQEGAEE